MVARESRVQEVRVRIGEALVVQQCPELQLALVTTETMTGMNPVEVRDPDEAMEVVNLDEIVSGPDLDGDHFEAVVVTAPATTKVMTKMTMSSRDVVAGGDVLEGAEENEIVTMIESAADVSSH